MQPNNPLLVHPAPPKVTQLNKRVVAAIAVVVVCLLAILVYAKPDPASWFARDRTPEPVYAAAPIEPPQESFDLPNLYGQEAAPVADRTVPPLAEAGPVPPPKTAPVISQRAHAGTPQKQGKTRFGAEGKAEPVKRGIPGVMTASASSTIGDGRAAADPFVLGARVQGPAGKYLVSAGKAIPAVLIDGINSDLPGMVVASVSEPVYDSRTGRYLLIPQATMLIGEYGSDIAYGQNRVEITWRRLIFPNTSSLSLDDGMPGADQQGYAGIRGKVNNHYGRLAIAVLASSVLATGSRFAAGDVSTYDGISPQQDLALNASREINRAGQEIVQRELRIKSTIVVKPGSRLLVKVLKDMVFDGPYKQD